MAKPPNLLFVFADQMRSTAVGCAGVEEVLTPRLDRFATEGTRFTNAISNTPLCCPARASLLTGLHVLQHRVVNNDILMDTSLPTVAQALNGAGYGCGYIGKWHLDDPDRGICIPPGPRRRGFEDYWATSNCNHEYNAAFYYLNDETEPRWFNDYEPNGQTDLAVDYLKRQAAGDKPFCLFVSWGPPHCPYDLVPKRFLDLYDPARIRLMPTAVDAGYYDHQEKRLLPRGEGEAAKRRAIAGYYGHCSALDHCFGRLLDTLREAHLDENTIVVFTSDHGDMLFSHNRGWKWKPWRESVGIPLLIRWPGRVPAGRVTDGPIGIVDFPTTLLGMAGVDGLAGVHGQNLSRFVQGEDTDAPDAQYINCPVVMGWSDMPPWRGVVTRTHTYTRFHDGNTLLYDDVADPFQTRNLAGQPSHADLQSRLELRLRKFLDQTNDPFQSSREVSDLYTPNHKNMFVPVFYNEKIRRGYELRRGRSY